MFLSIAIALTCIQACITGNAVPQEISRLNFFDTDLLRYAAEDRRGNVMVSPASIKSTLAMILESAAGDTEAEIRSALRLSPYKDELREQLNLYLASLNANTPGVKLQNSNSIFVSRRLKLRKEFEQIVRNAYYADVCPVDFSNTQTAVETVNKWVNQHTNGLIPRIVEASDINPISDALISNALYFKGLWRHAFNPKYTRAGCFHVDNSCQNSVMMELHEDLNYGFVDNLRAHAIELPYEGGRYSMILLVPLDKGNLNTLIRDLPYMSLPQISELMEPSNVRLFMPKFTVDYSESMVGPLRNLSGVIYNMKPLLLVLVLAVGLSNARWMRKQRSNQPKDTRFIGEATNELSTTILQGYIDDDKDIAFSPLGYTTILAILAEGAKGETRNQLISALHLPEDQNLIRKTYRYILERLKFRNEYKYNQPELKNFFYIYKNYTINEDYKKILEDFYLTDVRSVERYHMLEDNEGEKDKKDEEKVDTVPDLMPSKDSDEKLISYAVEDVPTKVDISHIHNKPAKNIKEKIKYAKNSHDTKYETDDDEETMVAVEARNHGRSSEYRVLNEKNDIASSISVNSVGGKSSKSSNSLMLIFNGMYFRGSWKKPFDKVESGVFYKSNTEKKQVQIMKTRGSFKTNSFPELDSEAILLPYDGDRYALLLLVPRTRDGLIRLIADLPAVSLADIQERLHEEELKVSLPTFTVETTTKPVAALAKFGVSSIFGRDAELTGISAKEGLFVQELVQNVAVRVDNTDASASSITASNAGAELEALESLKNLPLYEVKEPRRFCVEHPFVFYIIDRLDKLVVVAGKVNDPQAPSADKLKL
ncbi:uncharacterized protein LOC112053547 [Bicyclus anynana]|uniref:Uncharacterized protein LOC112053547 n=1 Tax=Bicyclus anynana TaxID=110368 RepID=A0ABM3LZ32_BICAN|nr:uncharacterized protein LOC112053547 [Bicyclus anynana]